MKTQAWKNQFSGNAALPDFIPMCKLPRFWGEKTLWVGAMIGGNWF